MITFHIIIVISRWQLTFQTFDSQVWLLLHGTVLTSVPAGEASGRVIQHTDEMH